MPPIIRLPNRVRRPGVPWDPRNEPTNATHFPRLNINHLKRMKNSINRQAALYGNNSNSNAEYNVNAVVREQALRRNIAREVGLTQAQIAPYYHKYLNLVEANNRAVARGNRRSLGARVNSAVRTAAARFRNRPRISAMRGQLRHANVQAGRNMTGIPVEIRHMIAAMMMTPSPYARNRR